MAENYADLIPDYVLEGFGLPRRNSRVMNDRMARAFAGSPLGQAWDWGIRIGDRAYMRAPNTGLAIWSAKTREHLTVPGLRLVRPVSTTDGRFVIRGYRASQYVDGHTQQRIDEIVAAALRLDDALSTVTPPKILNEPMSETASDVALFLLADRVVRAPNQQEALIQALHARGLDEHTQRARCALRMIARLHEALADYEPLARPPQSVHADMLATTLFDGDRAPILTDIFPLARPRGYSAASVIVDALLCGAADSAIVGRFGHIEDLPQLMLRALSYRVAIHGLVIDHKNTTTSGEEIFDDLIIHPGENDDERVIANIQANIVGVVEYLVSTVFARM